MFFLTLLLLLQSLGSLAYSILWPGESFVSALYAGSKVLMFCLPLIAWKYYGISWRGCLPRISWRESMYTATIGVATMLTTGVALWFLLQSIIPFSFNDARAQVMAFGIGAPVAYLAFSLSISLVHSLFEEWYWRATAVPLLMRRMPFQRAAMIGGLAFSFHHILILSLFTSWPWAIALGLLVGVAGWAWSQLAHWRGHFWWSWASHIGADLAIFGVGGVVLGVFT